MSDTLPDTEQTFIEIAWVPVDQLRHFPGNANQGDVQGIRASLRRTGQYRALIVRREDDGTLTVLAGNNTLDALRAEGIDRARCEIHACDDDTARRINIADNKIARAAVVDEDALLEQLSYLEGDYEGTGFTDGEVNYLLGEGGPPLDDGYETDGVDASGLLDDDPEADTGDSTDTGEPDSEADDEGTTGDEDDSGDTDAGGERQQYRGPAIRSVVFNLPAEQHTYLMDGVNELGRRYGTDFIADTILRLVADTLGTEPPQ